ncbi:MAG TPA: hypothetical protein VNB90_01825 [Cytophagaceae bacterium]|jgi:hypothetical protein|nr:hypothetical protein [Cytophagaceae bacterium]
MEKKEIIKKQEVFNIIFKELEKYMNEYGFQGIKKEYKFFKKTSKYYYEVYVSTASYGPLGHHLDFHFQSKSLDLIEYGEKFEEFFGNAILMNNGAGYSQNKYNKQFDKYIIKSDDDLSSALEDFKPIFITIGLPFFEQFSTLEALEKECNKDFKLTGLHFTECKNTGVMLSKMTGGNAKAVAEGYKNTLREMNLIESELLDSFKVLDALVAYQK